MLGPAAITTARRDLPSELPRSAAMLLPRCRCLTLRRALSNAAWPLRRSVRSTIWLCMACASCPGCQRGDAATPPARDAAASLRLFKRGSCPMSGILGFWLMRLLRILVSPDHLALGDEGYASTQALQCFALELILERQLGLLVDHVALDAEIAFQKVRHVVLQKILNREILSGSQ